MEELKRQLVEIKKNDYKFTGYNLDKLISEMLKNIGATDSELRDELIYRTFGQMIVTKNVLNKNQLKQLLDICVDDQHLFYRLGESETDSVFVRSFSVLIVPLILNVDHRYSFLSESEIKYVQKRLLAYVRNEKDLRGYVVGKGGAHALAHAADALEDIAKHRYIEEDDLTELLEIISAKILFSNSVFTHNEDERLALSAFSTIDRGLLSEQQILNWLNKLKFQLDTQKKLVSDLNGLYLKLNVRNFLYTLYFRLLYNNVGTTPQKEIEKILDSIRDF
ncbi:DUF2785 domain-containing protein [Sporosarcina aquimarina]|uniref:DUF2785 domain-containing protein n=1 Tax=Sporosarcina aquimarina TaxID=114975 RepID=UPI00203CBE3B|nr:DUF2785 domain-containing protein [Sporosarcina aquimarina]MCM3758241.1 DUF2785 domain-containing protein [Sporosarcina aquimarina]